MHGILPILLLVSLTATIIALAIGMFSLFKGGKFSRLYSNKAMQWRIYFHGITLFIFFLMLWLGRK
jgi:hypothetical protein